MVRADILRRRFAGAVLRRAGASTYIACLSNREIDALLDDAPKAGS